MKRPLLPLLLMLVAVALYVTRPYFRGGEDTIEYRGERFKMSKKYWSYEDYKDDPNNLATNELPRIEHAIVSANIGTSFSSREEFSHAVFRLKFPGYGLSSLGDKRQSDGSTLSMMSVEIPQRDKDRYLVAWGTGLFKLVDDFVLNSPSNRIVEVKLEGTKLIYSDAKGIRIRDHDITQ